MVMTPRLDLRQSQSLVMTPQLQQAIKLLQLSNLELSEYVAQELEQNPMLERDEGDRRDEGAERTMEAAEVSSSATGEEAAGDGASEADGTALDSIDFSAAAPAEIPTEAGLDVDYDNDYTNDSEWDSMADTVGTPVNDGGLGPAFSETSGSGGGGGFDLLAPDLEQTVSENPSLRDHLMEQLGVELTDPADRLIGLHLIDMLDEAGYIRGALDDVADRLGCPVERVTATLERLQQFDPPGIFARDLAECLGLQLKELDRLDPCMEAFLENLEMLAARDLSGLGKACSADAEDIADMVAEIKALDPKPALAFDQDVAQPITPDVLMRPQPGGGWFIELNSDSLPRVLVNNHYYAKVRKEARTKDEKHYITEQFQTANWLVKSLHQRATTILKVATELVKQQDKFFRHGVQYLKPLVLRDIAEVIEMHESTVSRVTSNKYMATPRGIYELKYFFTSSVASTGGGEAVSAEAVRHHIKALIEAEDPKKILSDDKLVTLLRSEGIDVARRTVAKYRESLGLPSSVQRRREKAAPT